MTADGLRYRQQPRKIEYSGEYAPSTPNRLQVAVWAALLILALALYLVAFQLLQVGTWQDDKFYAILAQSMVRSDTYGLINEPGEQPFDAPFPFGYPLMLAPIVLLFPGDLEALKVPSLIVTLLNAAILFWGWPWFSRRSYWWGVAIVSLYLLSPFTVWFAGSVMSEAPFMTLCLVAMILAERAVRGKSSWWWTPLISITLVLVIFTRVVGAILVFSIFAYFLIVRRSELWKEMILIVVQMAIVGSITIGISPVLQPRDLVPPRYLQESNVWFQWAQSTPTEPDPGLEPVNMIEGADSAEKRVNLKELPMAYLQVANWHAEKHFRLGVIPFGGGDLERSLGERLGIPFLPSLVGYFISALLALGFLRWVAREGFSVFNLFAIFFIGVLLGWGWEGKRMLYPIQPQLHYAFLLGTEGILFWTTLFPKRTTFLKKFQNGFIALVVIVIILGSIYKTFEADRSQRNYGDFQARTSWLKSNTSPAATVMTEAPFVDYLYSERRTVPYPEGKISPDSFAIYLSKNSERVTAPYPEGAISTESLEDYLTSNNIDYILIAPEIAWAKDYTPVYSDRVQRILPQVADLSSDGRVKLVYSSEQDLIKVFQIRPNYGGE
jgi:hypothetical protein